MTTNQKVAGSSPAERARESLANRGVLLFLEPLFEVVGSQQLLGPAWGTTQQPVDQVGVGVSNHLRHSPERKPCERGGKVSPRPRTRSPLEEAISTCSSSRHCFYFATFLYEPLSATSASLVPSTMFFSFSKETSQVRVLKPLSVLTSMRSGPNTSDACKIRSRTSSAGSTKSVWMSITPSPILPPQALSRNIGRMS